MSWSKSSRVALLVTPLAVSALAVSSLPSAAAPGSAAADARQWFSRTATYPVFQNVPDGVDPTDPTVAEISDVSADGMTVAYTDALGGRIGFLDITDPRAPEGIGSYDVAGSPGGGSPTSVAIAPSSDGELALVVVDESTYPGLDDDLEPAIGVRDGRIDMVTLTAPHTLVASIDLGGQPDSIAISPDGAYAAIAIENERNEAFTPDGGEEGDLPQAPAGFVQVIELSNPDATTWEATPVALTAEDLAGLDTPQDAEPEYVDINDDNQAAVSLQENNGVAIIDLETATVETVWSAGNAVIEDIDTTDDGIFNPVDTIDLPREPDALQWVGEGLVATANEGDWKGGTRGWTVFDAATGDIEWDAGNSFEKIAVEHGLFNDSRADNKGSEPEGMAFDTFNGTPYVFVGSERSNFVAVYDMTDPIAPLLEQVLPATNGPEGLLPVPARNLLVVSSEADEAAALVRATVGIFELGDTKPGFPSVVSQDLAGHPIGWGALGALSAQPGARDRVYAASDSAYATGRIYGIDLSTKPAVIDSLIEVTESGGDKPALDIEGLAARVGGGFWLANEGATGPANSLIRTDAAGVIQETVPLPTEISDHVRNWGLEGVAVSGKGAKETVWVALQRPLWVDPSVAAGAVVPLEGNVTRIGRYLPASGTWTWFSYPLSTTTVPGDWIGVSEITVVDKNTLAVIERDKQNGTTAAIKRIYTVAIPKKTSGELTPLKKKLALDVLPALRADNGWTQEKLEGLTITTGGQVVAVTDNDGVQDASGETVLLRLGKLRAVFGFDTKTKVAITKRAKRAGQILKLKASVMRADGGTVLLFDGKKQVAKAKLNGKGVAVFTIKKAQAGKHVYKVKYLGTTTARPSKSPVKVIRIARR